MIYDGISSMNRAVPWRGKNGTPARTETRITQGLWYVHVEAAIPPERLIWDTATVTKTIIVLNEDVDIVSTNVRNSGVRLGFAG